MKFIVNLLRILVGALYIFSGFVKAVDPLGTSYKMHDYFAAFGSVAFSGMWEQMNAYSTPFAVLMIVAEMVAGITLLIGWQPRLTVWFLMAMTLFFTLLTGFTYLSGFCPTVWFGIYSLVITLVFVWLAAAWNSKNRTRAFLGFIVLALVGLALIEYTTLLFACPFTETKMKVTDCGCFGDFIKLKPWQTFYKDLILDALIFILIAGVKHIKPVFKSATNNLISLAALTISVLFCFSNFLWGLPLIDFRPYKKGNNIKELRTMQKPEKRDFFFIYKNNKTGEQKGFSISELESMNADEWEFVDRKDSIIDPGIPAVITGFYIVDDSGADITDTLLSDNNYSLMIVSYKLGATQTDAFKEKLNPLAAACDKAGIKIFAVTGGDINTDPFRHEYQTAYPFYTADETPLKTIIRSNPGLVLIKNGVVINKWHHMQIPSFEQLNETYFAKK